MNRNTHARTHFTPHTKALSDFYGEKCTALVYTESTGRGGTITFLQTVCGGHILQEEGGPFSLRVKLDVFWIMSI